MSLLEAVKTDCFRPRRGRTQPSSPGPARYRSREEIGGPLFPLLRPLLPIEGMRAGFDQQSRALKAHCEAGRR